MRISKKWTISLLFRVDFNNFSGFWESGRFPNIPEFLSKFEKKFRENVKISSKIINTAGFRSFSIDILRKWLATYMQNSGVLTKF